jgi:hypothetical protein
MAVPDLKLSAPLGATNPALLATSRRWLTAGMTPLYVAVFVYVLMLCLGGRLLVDPDTYFHIAAGNWIWAHHSVPSTDPFSATMQNAPWIAHEWLAELILAAAYGAGGWAGVVAATAAAIAAAYFLLARFLGHILSTVATLLGVIPSFLLASPHFLARPHVLAMPVLVAWTAGLAQSREKNLPPSYWLLPLMALWANLHGGFVIGLALIGAYALEAVIAAPDWPQRRHVARQWGAFFLAACLTSLVTPYGIQGPLFALHLSSLTFSLSVVNEWRGTDFGSFQPLELWIIALLGLGFVMRMRLPLVKLLVLLGLIHLALVHRRNSELLALVAPFLLAGPVTQTVREAASHVVPENPPARYYLAGIFAMAMASCVALWHGLAHDDQRVSPTHALAAAAAAGLTGPVFNAYGFGGYLIFAGIPPFVDGRIDLYGDTLMHEYIDAISAKDQALSNALDHYHIEWTLLEPQMAAVIELDHSPGWERVYADASAVVHRRVPKPLTSGTDTAP